MSKVSILLACLFGACSAVAAADKPKLSKVLAASNVALNGYIDAAYSYLNGGGQFTSGAADRVCDTEPDAFNLHQVALTAAYQPKEGFGGYVSLTAGRDARVRPLFDGEH